MNQSFISKNWVQNSFETCWLFRISTAKIGVRIIFLKKVGTDEKGLEMIEICIIKA